MVGRAGALTLLEIVALDYRKQGGKGQWPTKKFLIEWRKRNPVYDGARLDDRFWSGSVCRVKPYFRLQRATDAWLAAGNEFPVLSDEFNEFLESFTDIYTELDGPDAEKQ